MQPSNHEFQVDTHLVMHLIKSKKGVFLVNIQEIHGMAAFDEHGCYSLWPTQESPSMFSDIFKIFVTLKF